MEAAVERRRGRGKSDKIKRISDGWEVSISAARSKCSKDRKRTLLRATFRGTTESVEHAPLPGVSLLHSESAEAAAALELLRKKATVRHTRKKCTYAI